MSFRTASILFAGFIALAGLFSMTAAQTFTDITVSSGIQGIRDTRPADWWMSGGHLVDLDGDGDLDFFYSSHGSYGAMAALNDGTGHYTLATGTIPASEIHLTVDINEDGKVDLECTEADGGGRWWINNSTPGNLNFTKSTVGRDGNTARQQSMVDINKDGKVDWLRGPQNQVCIDLGDGRGVFALNSKTFSLNMGAGADGITPIPCDLDNSGTKSLIVTWGRYDYQNGRSRIYQNDGNMNFTDITTAAGLYQDGFCVKGLGDFDQDGDLDLVALENNTFPASIYLNDGAGHFTKKAGAMTGKTGTPADAGWGIAAMTDFDNDGIPDIIMNGKDWLSVFRGTGGGNFTYMNTTWGGITDRALAAVDGGIGFGDIDQDGDLEIIGGTGTVNANLKLYQNNLPAKNWLNIRPVGLAGNKCAAGSKIRVFAPGTTTLLWYEEVIIYDQQAAQNYYGYDQTERHMGLNTRASVDVEVEFYPSGKKVKQSGVAANTTVVISEGTVGLEGSQSAVGGEARSEKIQLEVSPNPFTAAANISFNVGTPRGASVQLSVYNAAGECVATLMNGMVHAGGHSALWNAAKMPMGVYVARLSAGTQTRSVKLLLTK